MDEAASRIRMEVESKPEEIENLDRASSSSRSSARR
jgi:ATP-dependent Clp protease ATP-binding subunit ClpA